MSNQSTKVNQTGLNYWDLADLPVYRVFPCDQIKQGLKNRKRLNICIWNPMVNKYTKVTKQWAMSQAWESKRSNGVEYYMTVYPEGNAFIDTMPTVKGSRGPW